MFGIVVTKNYITVELNLPVVSNQTKTNFQNITELQDRMIYGIDVYTSTQITVSQASKNVITAAGATGLAVTFYDKQRQVLRDYPVEDLIRSTNSGVARAFIPFIINWQQSFVQVWDSTNLTAAQSIIFGFAYDEKRVRL